MCTNDASLKDTTIILDTEITLSSICNLKWKGHEVSTQTNLQSHLGQSRQDRCRFHRYCHYCLDLYCQNLIYLRYLHTRYHPRYLPCLLHDKS